MTPYDTWRLSPPETDTVGVEEGQPCGRYHEPDEDAPRGYKPKPCTGKMTDDHGVIMCDVCGEIA